MMDYKEKRNFIKQYIDVSKARLKNSEVDSLYNYINNYESDYKGKSEKKERTITGWSSDGKYRRKEETVYTFDEDYGINKEYSYCDDDGQRGGSQNIIKDARGILNCLEIIGSNFL